MKNILFIIAAFFISVPAAFAQTASQPETTAKQAIILDFETGEVLYEKNADEKMPTSSMSKVLTTIVIYDAIREGKIKWDDELPVSERAWKEGGSASGGSTMFLDLNSKAKVSDLIKGIVIQSGNDACIVMAEGIAGTEENFAGLLNDKADDIGMKHSHFMNASGLPDPNHYSTARDLAKMAVYLIQEYPEDYKFYSEKEFVYNNVRQGNRNPLLYKTIGADGIKTGHTVDGGYGMIGSAVANGRRVIMVINGTSSMQARADESEKLMKWAEVSFKNIDLVKKDAVVGKAPVVLGVARDVPFVASKDVKATVSAFDKNPAQLVANYKVPLTAPVKAGDPVGELVITLGNGTKLTSPLVAAADVEEASFFSRLSEKFMLMVVGAPKYQ
ncbi:MAG TPA: D-alanyl-D-alanine carboxypeptidase [Rhodospirillaceae bacterium]|nr:D-alanyl-D-alanine carboxypeptidase [Rhodospirillaceae bacterium]